YSTYLAGSLSDAGTGIAVDSSGTAYVLGYTESTDFPTQNAYQAALAGGNDAFVTRLNATGSGLIYSSYLGGSGNEGDHTGVGAGIAVDGSGDAYVTSYTSSANFPTKNAFQTAYGGNFDAFVAGFNTNQSGASSLLMSTYLGGNSGDEGFGIALDGSDN